MSDMSTTATSAICMSATAAILVLCLMSWGMPVCRRMVEWEDDGGDGGGGPEGQFGCNPPIPNPPDLRPSLFSEGGDPTAPLPKKGREDA
eukprot:2583415-Pyramimonas_sp.AAC.1